MNVRASPFFVPPRPPPPAAGLGWYRFLKTIGTNGAEVWPKAAYEQDVVEGPGFGLMLLNGADAIRRVLVDNTGHYRLSRLTTLHYTIFGNGLLLSEGDDWRHQRRTIAPALGPRVVRMHARHVATITGEAVARIAAGPTRDVDILSIVKFLALDVAARSMFSLEMHQYGPALRSLIEWYRVDLARPLFFDLVLPAWIPTLRYFARQRFRSQWISLMDTIIAARQRESPSDKPRDLFDMLVAARDPETGAAFSHDELRDQVATMIVTGNETTALTLFWSLYLLASAPAEQQRVADEVRDIDLSPNGAAEALPKLSYTKAVVNEALRLYPPAPTLARVAVAADRIGDLNIPVGTFVVISPWVLHRHVRLWKEPDAFDPSRFLDGTPLAHRYAYMPFGAGPRICVGAQLALTEACLVLATMVQRFDVALADAIPVLPVTGLLTHPDHPARFRLRARV